MQVLHCTHDLDKDSVDRHGTAEHWYPVPGAARDAWVHPHASAPFRNQVPRVGFSRLRRTVPRYAGAGNPNGFMRSSPGTRMRAALWRR